MSGADVSSESHAPGPQRLLLAWGVHLFTASGAIVGAMALLAVDRGAWGAASLLMLAGLLIDSVDGTLARRVGVSTLVPEIDGRRLDDIVDFLNYAIVPVVFLVALGALPHWSLAVVPLLASAYGFSQTDAKTEDDFFLGWPSYWNVVAVYTWLLGLSPATATVIVMVLSVAVFVPLKYVYPSKLRVWRGATVAGACLWGTLVVGAIAAPETAARLRWVEISLLYPAYYLALSAWLGGWLRRRPA